MKMIKHISVTFTFLLIASIQQTCVSQDPVTVVRVAINIGLFVKRISDELLKEAETLDETLWIIKNMNQNIRNDLRDIMKILKDLPSIVYHTQKQYHLDDTFNKIGWIFGESVRMQRKIQNGVIEDTKIYAEFAARGNEIDMHMNTIRNIILSQDTMRDLIENFTSTSQVLHLYIHILCYINNDLSLFLTYVDEV